MKAKSSCCVNRLEKTSILLLPIICVPISNFQRENKTKTFPIAMCTQSIIQHSRSIFPLVFFPLVLAKKCSCIDDITEKTEEEHKRTKTGSFG
jgi:hypothetical protein